MSTRKPKKPQPPVTRGRISKASANPNYLAASTIATSSTSTGKEINIYGFKTLVYSVSDQESIPISKKSHGRQIL